MRSRLSLALSLALCHTHTHALSLSLSLTLSVRQVRRSSGGISWTRARFGRQNFAAPISWVTTCRFLAESEKKMNECRSGDVLAAFSGRARVPDVGGQRQNIPPAPQDPRHRHAPLAGTT